MYIIWADTLRGEGWVHWDSFSFLFSLLCMIYQSFLSHKIKMSSEWGVTWCNWDIPYIFSMYVMKKIKDFINEILKSYENDFHKKQFLDGSQFHWTETKEYIAFVVPVLWYRLQDLSWKNKLHILKSLHKNWDSFISLLRLNIQQT